MKTFENIKHLKPSYKRLMKTWNFLKNQRLKGQGRKR